MTSKLMQTAVLLTLFLLFFTVSTATAAPFGGETAVSDTVRFAESINPPDWVGFLMVLIALTLPAALFFWMRQQK